MAQISLDQLESYEGARGNGERLFNFFALRNNGDKALVRILYNNPSEFMLYSYHNINGENRTFRINCLRTDRDAINSCPLCASGFNTKTSFFIPMVQYFVDGNNNITQQLVMWERSLTYCRTLQDLMNEYGPLSNTLFTITRNGAAGSKDTKYSILLANPKMYPDEAYPIDSTILENRSKVNIVGTLIWDKSVAEMNEFLQTGNFPNPNAAPATQTTQQLPNFNVNGVVHQTEQLPNIPPAPFATPGYDTTANAYQPAAATPTSNVPPAYTVPQPANPPAAAPTATPAATAPAPGRPRRYY